MQRDRKLLPFNITEGNGGRPYVQVGAWAKQPSPTALITCLCLLGVCGWRMVLVADQTWVGWPASADLLRDILSP